MDTTSTQQKTIGLFYRHQEAFIKMISKFYAFNPTQIRKYSDVLDFKLLSRNPNCKWDNDTVNHYIDKIDWFYFSFWSSFWKDPSNIEKYKNHIPHELKSQIQKEYYYRVGTYKPISQNKNVPWTLELISKYINLIDFAELSFSSNVKWTYDLLDKFINKWDWSVLSLNKGIPWSIDFIERYADKWVWYFISQNEMISWNLELFKLFYDRIDLQSMEYNPLAYNRLTSNLDVIDNYYDVLNWELICANQNLPWIEEQLMDKWKNHLNWDGIAMNEVLFRNNPNFFYQHIDKWNDDIFQEKLSKNTALPWSIKFIEEYDEKWDWKYLAKNPGLPWSKDLIYKYLKNGTSTHQQ